MKKTNNDKEDNTKELNEKLEAIIEHSKAENEALRKILRGLEKNKDTIKIKKDSIKTNKKK